MDAGNQLAGGSIFGDKIGGIEFEGFHEFFHLQDGAGEEYHRKGPGCRRRAQPSQHFQSIQSRHPDVEEEQVRLFQCSHRKGLCAVRRLNDVEFSSPEGVFEKGPDGWFVVHDKDFLHEGPFG